MARTNSELTGLQKASVLLMTLGTEASEAILKRLSPEERDLIGSQITQMQSVKSTVREQVLGEVSNAMKFGVTRDSEPFRWLERLPADHVASLIKKERPHTIALVLSNLTPNAASAVLGCLDEKTRNSTAHCLTHSSRASDEVIKTVDDLLRHRAMSTSDSSNTNQLLKTLGEATTRARASVLSALTKQPTPQVTTVTSTANAAGPDAVSLEELAFMPDWRIKVLLGEADIDDLCLALRVASDDLKAAVMRNVPPSTAALMQDRINHTAQIRVREIEIAQRRVLGAIRRAGAVAGEGPIEQGH